MISGTLFVVVVIRIRINSSECMKVIQNPRSESPSSSDESPISTPSNSDGSSSDSRERDIIMDIIIRE